MYISLSMIEFSDQVMSTVPAQTIQVGLSLGASAYKTQHDIVCLDQKSYQFPYLGQGLSITSLSRHDRSQWFEAIQRATMSSAEKTRRENGRRANERRIVRAESAKTVRMKLFCIDLLWPVEACEILRLRLNALNSLPR